MRILSVSTNLPTIAEPFRGLFVQRRLAMVAEFAELRAMVPQPWFPIIKPKFQDRQPPEAPFPIDIRPMFYFPKFLKRLDGMWMDRCVGRWLDEFPASATGKPVLDAQFGYPEGVGCHRAAELRGLPFFVTIRGLEMELFHDKHIGPALLASLQSATGVIAVSHSLRDAAIGAGIAPEKVSVVPNGVDHDTFCHGSKSQARRELGVSDSTLLIVSVGHLRHVKGHDVLIRSLATIDGQTDFRLVCLGVHTDPDFVTQIRNLADKNGMLSKVEFPGPKPSLEVVKWLRACDIFALASRREGCCNAILEALAVGAPVVATNVGDNAHYVKEAFSGAIVPSEDHVAMGRAILRTHEANLSRDEIAKSMKQFTWSSTARNVVQFMNEKLGS